MPTLKRSTPRRPDVDHAAAWWRNAATLWEIGLAAPQVIAQRTTRMVLAGATPSARDRREFARMGREKAEAFGESWLAMGLRLWQVQTAAAAQWWGQWMRQGPQLLLAAEQPLLQAWPHVMASGLKPVHRRVTANARRLIASPARRSR
jgi:hypothetical protein